MKKIILALLAGLLIPCSNFAQEVDSLQLRINQIEESLTYQTGNIELAAGNATLQVPKGFRYLDKTQSAYVLTDLWGNPADSSILGMLVLENRGVLAGNSWVFTISFEEMGYVKDDDVDKINYDDLLKEIQKERKAANAERVKQGFETIEMIGWASAPYYDKEKKVLHWAKEAKFGSSTSHTLNYNLRILGRKGVFMLNAVASMSELPEVKASIDNVLGSVQFKEGFKYSDFVPSVDNVAAWTIGGLVAGKILTKAGIFVVLAKFWKLIVFGVVAVVAGIWKFFTGKKDDNKTPQA